MSSAKPGPILGVWAPAMWLTYVGAAAGTVGIVATIWHHATIACALLVLAGLADLFDGPLARRLHRDQHSRNFGAQLDSLADVASFLALPIVLLATTADTWWFALAGVPYVLAGIARLAHFATEEIEGTRTHYRGLPVTYAALVVPLVAIVSTSLLPLALIALSVAFVVDVPVRKPAGPALIALAAIAVALFVALALVGVR